MELVAFLCRVIVGVVLFTSALEKLRSPVAFQLTLQALRVRRTGGWWLLVSLAELLTAVGMVAPVPPAVAAGAVAGLGLLFACAGVQALRLGRVVRCACLGASGNGRLGWPQVVALPVWIALAVGVLGWGPATGSERTVLLAVILLTALASYMWRLATLTVRARNDRIAVRHSMHAGRTDSPERLDRVKESV